MVVSALNLRLERRVIFMRLLALALLLAHSALAVLPLPVASTTRETCTDAAWRTDAAGTSQINKVTALVSGQGSDPTQITVSALSLERPGRFNRRAHQ